MDRLMGKHNLYAITGIDYNEMCDLSRHGIKTFELCSADHAVIGKKLKKGDLVFVTNLSKADMRRGVAGLMGKVKDIKQDYWRTVPREFDENELFTTRIQIEYVDEARVKNAKDLGHGCGMQADVETHVLVLG
ncbi:MAG: DUF473 family protein [Candidatus Micrarchaeota archaeon]